MTLSPDNSVDSSPSISVGDIFDVRVRWVENKLIHVRVLDGIDGIIRKKEYAYGTSNLADIVSKGDVFKAIVLSVPGDKQKHYYLSRKRLLDSPWDSLSIENGQTVEGVVQFIGSQCVLVGIESVVGLLPISELTWEDEAPDPNEYVYVGQKVSVKVISVDPKKEKLKVSLRRTESPWKNLDLEPGMTLEAPITRKLGFGYILKLKEGIFALLHKENLDWTKSSTEHLLKTLKIGDVIPVSIISIDHEAERIQVSRKHTQPNPYEAFIEEHPIGSSVEVTVLEYFKYKIHVSEKTLGTFSLQYKSSGIPPIEELSQMIPVGNTMTIWVKAYDPDTQKIQFEPGPVI